MAMSITARIRIEHSTRSGLTRAASFVFESTMSDSTASEVRLDSEMCQMFNYRDGIIVVHATPVFELIDTNCTFCHALLAAWVCKVPFYSITRIIL